MLATRKFSRSDRTIDHSICRFCDLCFSDTQAGCIANPGFCISHRSDSQLVILREYELALKHKYCKSRTKELIV